MRKTLVNIVKKILHSLVAIVAWVLASLTGPVPFPSMSEFLSLVPGRLGRALRYAYYCQALEYCGENVTFPLGVHLSYEDVRIGNNVRLGHFSALGKVHIGDDVLIAAFCFIPSGSKQHSFERLDIPIRLQPGSLRHIQIGNDVWIGANSVIMADIGNGCVIGAGSVVTKPIPPYSIARGNPAGVVQTRSAHPS